MKTLLKNLCTLVDETISDQIEKNRCLPRLGVVAKLIDIDSIVAWIREDYPFLFVTKIRIWLLALIQQRLKVKSKDRKAGWQRVRRAD